MLKRLILVRGAEIALFVVLAALPLAVDSQFVILLLTLLAIYGVGLIGLDITVGYLGQVNLSQAAMVGLGAYVAGIAATRYGVGIPLAMLLSGAFCTVVGALLALPALRLEGPQFALATFSFTALSATALNELESLTNGAQGLQIPRPLLLGHAVDARDFFWLCCAILALVWVAMRNLMTSQWGRAFEALRDSPIATDAMGVGVYRHKVAAFAFGSGLGGAAGALYAFNIGYLQPLAFGYELTVILLLGVVIGGRKSLWGAVVGAVLVALLPNLLSSHVLFSTLSAIAFVFALISGARGLIRRRTDAFRALAPIAATLLLVVGSFLASNIEDWRKAIFALLLFSVVVGLPEGLMGFASAGLARLFRVAPPELPPPAALDAVLPVHAHDGAVLLKLDGLSRHFGGVRAVDGVNLAVKAGTIHGLIGPNGSGKSTLVNVVSGLYAPSGGELRLRGAPLPRGKSVAAAKAGIARTFQNLQLFGGMTALENVMVALRGAWRVPLPLVLLGLGRLEEQRGRAAALALLELVGLRGEARTRATDLTYGAQRFLEIARALARRPELLILDEPAAGLAQPDVQRLLEIIRRVRQRGITMVLIEHHMDVVSELCEAVTVLDGGKVIAEGSPAQVKRDAKVIAAYLGAAEPDAVPPEAGAAPTPDLAPPEVVPAPDAPAGAPYRASPGGAAASSMLTVTDLHAGYGLSEVLVGVSLEVKAGTIVALIGANGAGKTTAMRAISGTIASTRGEVRLGGARVDGLGAARIARLGLAHSPEGRKVFGPLSTEDNLLLGAYSWLPHFFGFHRQAKDALDRVYDLFPRLAERRAQLAGTLSGGEQQMLAIGRALMAQPKIMLLDEPSMGLAPVIVQEVFRTIRRLKAEGMTMLLVEQFASAALAVADHVYVMERGRVAVSGTPDDLRRDPRVLAAYLG